MSWRSGLWTRFQTCWGSSRCIGRGGVVVGWRGGCVLGWVGGGVRLLFVTFLVLCIVSGML